MQWVQLHPITPREIATILAAARTEFPVVTLWRSSRELDDVRELMALETPEVFLGWQLLPIDRVEAMLTRFAAQIGINTDRNRWLEFQAPKHQLSRRDDRLANLQ